MRLSSIFSEAWRNVRDGASRAGLFLCAALVISLVLGGFDFFSINGVEQNARSEIEALGDTRALMGGSVDGVSCDRLSAPGSAIRQSGAFRKASRDLALLSSPGRSIPTYEVTAGTVRLIASSSSVFSGRLDPTGVWISTDLAKAYGLSVGRTVATTGGPVHITGVFSWPDDGRDTRFDYAFLLPVSSSGTFQECWARQWPVSNEMTSMLYTTAVVNNGSDHSAVMAVNKSLPEHNTVSNEYDNRITVWAPALGLFAGFALGLIAVRRRRLEYAGALHALQTHGAQLVGIIIETGSWALAAAICSCGVLAAMSFRLVNAEDVTAVIMQVCRTPIAVLCGALLGAITAGLFLRESHLLRYFKER
jgi:hypothetical protein